MLTKIYIIVRKRRDGIINIYKLRIKSDLEISSLSRFLLVIIFLCNRYVRNVCLYHDSLQEALFYIHPY